MIFFNIFISFPRFWPFIVFFVGISIDYIMKSKINIQGVIEIVDVTIILKSWQVGLHFSEEALLKFYFV